MPEFDSNADESLQERFDDAWEHMSDALADDIFEPLTEVLDKVDGYNRGGTSTAYMYARKGPGHTGHKIRLQNDCSESTIYHELAHMLTAAHGYDNTQEATTRANNKSNWTRWPQFSFGKKDSPVERFLMRRYHELPDIDRRTLTEDDFDELEERSDIFYTSDRWYEAYTWQGIDSRHERRRYVNPVVKEDDEMIEMQITPLSSTAPHSFMLSERESRDYTDVEIVNRWQSTPGLATILGRKEDEPNWEGLNRFMYELNTHWHEAVTLVRKRGEKRERGIAMSPRGANKSYYVMNTNEYMAELTAMMMQYTLDHSYSIDDYERLVEHCPDLIDAYEDVLLA